MILDKNRTYSHSTGTDSATIDSLYGSPVWIAGIPVFYISRLNFARVENKKITDIIF